jgi:hypothetical protein
MWKWNVALEAYQRHFGSFATKDSKLLEIGVQSGGSINMYHSVLPKTFYYGMDINHKCEAFKDPGSIIYFGDQGNEDTWLNFFNMITPMLDMCIDDGGRQAQQMLVTLRKVLPHMNKGGFFLTEDIRGQNQDYLQQFFHPAAEYLSSFLSLSGSRLESVHIYPFVLGVQMAGGSSWVPPRATLEVDNFPALTATIERNPGAVVRLANDQWGTMFSADGLNNFFNTFYDLYSGVVREEPVSCANSMANNCAMIASNTKYQKLVKGIHIYDREALVEVHSSPPVITAVRKGTEWMPYHGS